MEQERTAAQFFFEVGYGACWAEAYVRNGEKAPFPLTDAMVERAWQIAPEAHDDPAEFDRFHDLAAKAPELAARVKVLEAALAPFAAYADGVGQFSGPNSPFYIGFESHKIGQRFISEDDFARAKSALTPNQEEG